ncbi:MAG: L,D-transpeptidase, partial [Actinomycetota bacterium]|nr:L,D-transpeptidase [Actinomycetota bacterium]
MILALLVVLPLFGLGHEGAFGRNFYPGKRIVISIADQTIYFLEDDILVKAHLCSTGKDSTPTPTGVFSVTSHMPYQPSGNVILYHLLWFHPNYAMHSLLYDPKTQTWKGADTLGRKASHGCVRQANHDAEWAYNWVPDGTRVDIIEQHFELPPPPPEPYTGGHCAVGVPSPAKTFYFAEGTCRPGFETYLAILNPSGETQEVEVTYMLGDSTTRGQNVVVPPASRYTISVKEFLGEADDQAHDFS